MSELATSEMVVRPLSDAMGAEVIGVDTATMDDADFERLRDALHEHIMLAVRDQALDPVSQTAFARRFGEIQYHINSEYKMKDQPEVLTFADGRVLVAGRARTSDIAKGVNRVEYR